MTTARHQPMAPDAEQRHRMIQVAAYYLAEQRGFAPGHAEHDWIRAEHEIERMIERLRAAGQSPASLGETDIRNALRLRPD